MMSDRLPVTVARELERINREHDLEFDSPALVWDWLCHPAVLVSDLMGKPDAKALGDALVRRCRSLLMMKPSRRKSWWRKSIACSH